MYARVRTCALPHRFGNSTLHQRDSRSALFEGYSGGSGSGSGSGSGGGDATRRQYSASPAGGYGYGYQGGSNGSSVGGHLAVENKGYRPATPNRKYANSSTYLPTYPHCPGAHEGYG